MKHIFLFIAVVILFNCKPEKEEPKPLTAPVLTTMEAGDITAISALSGGAISSDGGSPVTARGIVWSLSHNPTLSDSVSEEGTGIGSFTSDLTPLKYSTTYYVRAYATNSIGTTYGNEVTFNTKAAVPSDGLVGWWPFNGNANDESGNGNDGEVNGATLTNDRNNFKNSAYQFNGNEVIQTNIPSNYAPASTSEYTMTFWSSINNFATSKIYISYEYGNNTSNYTVMSSHSECADQTIAFQNFPFNNPSACSPENINSNQWYHLTVVLNSNNGTGAVYKNGDLWFTGSISNLVPDAGSLNFGNNGINGSFGISGILDDIAIYNRALTAEEIQKIYNGTGF